MKDTAASKYTAIKTYHTRHDRVVEGVAYRCSGCGGIWFKEKEIKEHQCHRGLLQS
jgi:hypothetical protein